MRRGVWLLVLGVLLAALGAASAYGAGGGTTTAETTTSDTTTPVTTTTSTTTTTATTTTTTATTTTTTAKTTTTAPTTTARTTTTSRPPRRYSSLPASYLPSSCIGAGAAAIAEPGSRVLGLGTPASSRAASAYPTRSPIVRFLSLTGGGSSSCGSGHVSVGSVSLFGGVITAQSVSAVHGHGAVTGLAIYGSPAALGAGDSVSVGGWAQVTLQKTVGRLTAPLVVELTAPHGGLPAGTTVAVAFSASRQSAHSAARARNGKGSASQKKAAKAARTQKSAPVEFPVAPDPFLTNDVLTPAAKHNAVVASAIQYLGIKYQWGGATPATGFDCSGLVTYVFAKLGVSLPHYTVSQYTSPDGVWVSPHHLEAGDLVFFVGSDGTRKAPGHVGIYVGDGYFIDAPHTGAFVEVDSLKDKRFANQYVGARRIEAQLLVSRHLLDEADKPKVLEEAPFLHALSFQASGALPLPTLTAAVPTAEHIPVGGSDMLLLVGVPLGGLLALSAAGSGAFFVRKRRREDLPEAPLH